MEEDLLEKESKEQLLDLLVGATWYFFFFNMSAVLSYPSWMIIRSPGKLLQNF